jgi:malate dehydrogenase (oxaloacetate-decarboxylating)(NADP+)
VVLGRGGGGRKVWTLLERRTMMNGVEKTNGEDIAMEEQLITPWTSSVSR